MTFRCTPTILLVLLFLIGGGCQSRSHDGWAGTWAGEPGHNGDLSCTAERTGEHDWKARFTGHCGRQFAFEVTMHGKAEGDAVRFEGDEDLGKENGGVYTWSGVMRGDQFTGRYTSTMGKKGTFAMTREPESRTPSRAKSERRNQLTGGK